jgi:hypothetical protein
MKRKKEHYVNNKEFSQAVVDYVTAVREARDAHESEPIIPNYIGECFLKICEGLSHKPNFISYTYREEMVMDAVENCVKAIMNYDINKATRTGLPNAFSYFTQISYYAFLRRIAKEKKQQDIKELYMDYAGDGAFADFTEYEGKSGAVIDRIRHKTQQIRERDNKLKDFGKKVKQARKQKAGPIDDFIN